jgi:hypothetical protein
MCKNATWVIHWVWEIDPMGLENKSMSIRTVGLAVVLLAVGLLVFKFVPRAEQLRADLEKPLNEVALASLQTDYNVLVTGDLPSDGLIARLNGWSRTYLTADERIEAGLKLRESGLERGVRYTGVEVALTPVGVERQGNKVVLHAKDRFTEHREYTPAWPGAPTESGGVTNHDFVFSSVRASANTTPSSYSVQVGGIVYTLILDVNGAQMLQRRHGSTYCCDPDEQHYVSQPAGPALEDKPETVPPK